jgi:hypothetical protein
MARGKHVQHYTLHWHGRLFLYFNLVIYPVPIYFLAFSHHTAFRNLNITIMMQPVILDDGKELSLSESDATSDCQATEDEDESDALCQATEDEDYYLNLVTFEVKG